MKQGNVYLSENLVIIIKPYSKDNAEENIEFSQLHQQLINIIHEHVKTRFFKERKNNDKNCKIEDKIDLEKYLSQKVHIIDYQQFKVLIPFLLIKTTCHMPLSVYFDEKFKNDDKQNLNSEIQKIRQKVESEFNIINKYTEQYLDEKDDSIKNIFHQILNISKNNYKHYNGNINNLMKKEIEGEILIIYDPKADVPAKDSILREKQRAEKEEIIKRIHMIIPGVNIEYFKIDIEEIKKEQTKTNDYMDSAHPLYHLASRVCACFVEYYSTYHCNKIKVNKTNNIKCKMSFPNVDISRGVELFTPCFVDNQKKACYPELFVRKILDVKDALDIVGEGVDGNTHDYPPCPLELQSIYQGWDNQAESVRERYKFPYGIWFRGNPRVCNMLLPSLFRGTMPCPLHPGCDNYNYDASPFVYDETSMLYQFMAVRPQLKHEYTSAFEWLSMAQHYSAPSRVLDWSENILVALYFAVMDNTNNCDSAVWAINAGRLNELTRVTIPRRSICMPGSVDVVLRSAMAFTKDRSELKGYLLKINQYDFVKHHFLDVGKIKEVSSELKKDAKHFIKWLDGEENEFIGSKMWKRLSSPIAVFPSRINDRQVAQLACFTLYGGKEYVPKLNILDKDKYPSYRSLLEINREAIMNSKKLGKPFLHMFIVPSFAKRKIREQLRRIGIHQVSLMPELENQAKTLGRQWSTDVVL